MQRNNARRKDGGELQKSIYEKKKEEKENTES